MPFETLRPAAEIGTLPEGLENSLTVTSDIPNVDRFGGSLRTDPENDQLIYTDVGGVEIALSYVGTDADEHYVQFLQDFRLPPVGQPAVFGSDLTSFLVPLVDVRPPDFEGGFPSDVGYLTVEVTQDGTVTAQLDFREGPVAGSPTENFDVYPLGDGRIGYVTGQAGSAFGRNYGVLEIGENVPSIQNRDGLGATDTDPIFAALPDGGTILVIEDPESTPAGRLKAVQYDSNDEIIESGYIDSFALENRDAEIAGIQIDENGELEVYYEVLPESATDPTYFRETYDLLPAADDETVIPTEDDDLLDLTSGDDFVNALGGNDTVFGRGGSDVITGGVGNDDLRGGAGNDSNSDQTAGISGGDGDDFIRGNHGDDALFGDDGADNMNGGFGNDLVYGGVGDDKVSGFDGNDILFGDDGADRMHGGRGDDALDGGGGDDTLRGAEGADTLTGGEGDDLLIGGEGADTYAFDLTADNGTDLIKDFIIGEDKIALNGNNDLTFDDIFLSQEDSAAIIQAGDTTIRLKGTDIEDLSEDDFLLWKLLVFSWWRPEVCTSGPPMLQRSMCLLSSERTLFKPIQDFLFHPPNAVRAQHYPLGEIACLLQSSGNPPIFNGAQP